jgi:hypothetical protein
MFIFRQDPVIGWMFVMTTNYKITVLKTKLGYLVFVEDSCCGAVNIMSHIIRSVLLISFHGLNLGIKFILLVTQKGNIEMHFNPFEYIQTYISLRYIATSREMWMSLKCVHSYSFNSTDFCCFFSQNFNG